MYIAGDKLIQPTNAPAYKALCVFLLCPDLHRCLEIIGLSFKLYHL